MHVCMRAHGQARTYARTNIESTMLTIQHSKMLWFMDVNETYDETIKCQEIILLTETLLRSHGS